jgi:hypothetical protein
MRPPDALFLVCTFLVKFAEFSRQPLVFSPWPGVIWQRSVMREHSRSRSFSV